MKQQDVGPVPVVFDHTQMQLAGIVTDRDIALNVVAEGRDPYSTRVDSIMTGNPVTCTEDQDVLDAVKIMAEYQVRRLPVVDADGTVVGIISQADIARHANEEEVGEMVEEISQPFGVGEWNGTHESRSYNPSLRAGKAGLDPASALAISALCVGFGAGLMYLFDPSRGRKRRAQIQQRGTELWNHRGEVVNKAQNMIGHATSRFTGNSDAAERTTSGPQERSGIYSSAAAEPPTL